MHGYIKSKTHEGNKSAHKKQNSTLKTHQHVKKSTYLLKEHLKKKETHRQQVSTPKTT